MTTVIDMQYDVGPGWRPLLWELHEQLGNAGISYETLQAKEKFGTLRVYISVAGEWHPAFDLTIPGEGTITWHEGGSETWKKAMDIVHAVEARSASICEDCGEPGILRTDRSWLRTLCEACNGR